MLTNLDTRQRDPATGTSAIQRNGPHNIAPDTNTTDYVLSYTTTLTDWEHPIPAGAPTAEKIVNK